jgi:tetratricopeptide (TPR) repeat protein
MATKKKKTGKKKSSGKKKKKVAKKAKAPKLTGNETLEELAEMGVEITPELVAKYESQMSDDDLMKFIDDGTVQTEWEDEREFPINEENLKKFMIGEMTWAQLEGITMEQAYAFAELGYTLFEQGRYDEAQQIFEGLVISNPYDGYLHSVLGSIYARKDMHEEAVVEYSIAMELDPENIMVYVNRAEILLQHGEFEYAMDDLKAAIDLDPNGEDPAGLRARALAAATAGLIEEVLAQKEKTGGGGAKKKKKKKAAAKR